MGRRPKIGRDQLAKTDLSKSVQEIALDLGVSPGTIYRAADRLNFETHKKRVDTDWGAIDWQNLTTSQVIELTGRSRQRVSLMRKKLAPDTVKQLV